MAGPPAYTDRAAPAPPSPLRGGNEGGGPSVAAWTTPTPALPSRGRGRKNHDLVALVRRIFEEPVIDALVEPAFRAELVEGEVEGFDEVGAGGEDEAERIGLDGFARLLEGP